MRTPRIALFAVGLLAAIGGHIAAQDKDSPKKPSGRQPIPEDMMKVLKQFVGHWKLKGYYAPTVGEHKYIDMKGHSKGNVILNEYYLQIDDAYTTKNGLYKEARHIMTYSSEYEIFYCWSLFDSKLDIFHGRGLNVGNNIGIAWSDPYSNGTRGRTDSFKKGNQWISSVYTIKNKTAYFHEFQKEASRINEPPDNNARDPNSKSIPPPKKANILQKYVGRWKSKGTFEIVGVKTTTYTREYEALPVLCDHFICSNSTLTYENGDKRESTNMIFYNVEDSEYFRCSFTSSGNARVYSGTFNEDKSVMTWIIGDPSPNRELNETLIDTFVSADRIKSAGVIKRGDKIAARYEGESIRQKDPQ